MSSYYRSFPFCAFLFLPQESLGPFKPLDFSSFSSHSLCQNMSYRSCPPGIESLYCADITNKEYTDYPSFSLLTWLVELVAFQRCHQLEMSLIFTGPFWLFSLLSDVTSSSRKPCLQDSFLSLLLFFFFEDHQRREQMHTVLRSISLKQHLRVSSLTGPCPWALVWT